MKLHLKPRIFLSYSRQDMGSADLLARHLESGGCDVVVDRNEIIVGDDFVQGLQQELSTCDGLVALMTETSVGSSWCQAEIQRALSLGLPIFVVQRDQAARFPDALSRLLRDRQSLLWTGEEPPALAGQIERARARRRRIVLRRMMLWASVASFFVALIAIAISRLDLIEAGVRRNEVLRKIADSKMFWSRAELDSVLVPVGADTEIPAHLQQLADDATQPTPARHNAWQSLAALHERREREWRLSVPEVNWAGGRIHDALWANVSYQRGTIRDLVVSRSRIAGVVLGSGPKEDTPGLSLLSVRITDSDLWFFRCDGTQLLDVEFTNSKFRGAQLDLSGHAGVRFLSRDQNLVLIGTDLTIIEDSWILQRNLLPEAHVVDLAEPEQEILFDGVQFARTRFEGHFRPDWFRGNHFQDCVFATSLDRARMEAEGNSFEGAVWLDSAHFPED